jgi:GntR family transcriptional regulator / MocR family aminotransferase
MARRATSLPLGIAFAPPQRAKTRWVVDALRIAIREGRLSPGSQMPSTRDLAEQWAISRGLVSAAYEELSAEGLLEARRGSGTYVSDRNGPKAVRAAEPIDDPDSGALPDWIRVDPERPFISRETDVARFPVGLWKRLANRVLSGADFDFFYDPDPSGHHALRQQVARYLGFARGIACAADDILITTGTRHSLDLCLRALAAPGDAVWLESPGYAGAEALVRSLGLKAVPVPVDRQGLRVDHAAAVAPDAKLCLVTPSHQSPLGVRLGVERREAMLDWACRADSYIVEDDYDGEFAFEAVRFPAFKAMDSADRIIHAGSFNKSLFPTLRVGYIVVPRSLRARLRAARAETGRGNSAFDQHILTHFMADGHFAHHIRRMERVYRDKSLAAQRAIQDAYGGPLPMLGTQGGFHFFLVLPAELNRPVFRDACRRAGLTLQTAALAASDESDRPLQGLVIGYSSLTLDTIDRAGARLGQLMRAA